MAEIIHFKIKYAMSCIQIFQIFLDVKNQYFKKPKANMINVQQLEAC